MMKKITIFVFEAVLINAAMLIQSTADAKHWPDFSCHPYKKTTQRENSVNYYKASWESCKESHEKYKQECDKMCSLRHSLVVTKKKGQPFVFDIAAFITLMLNEMGYEDEHRKEAPQKLVDEVTAKLQICKTTHREFETMTNVRYLPCEPYKDLFACVHNATGCSGDNY